MPSKKFLAAAAAISVALGAVIDSGVIPAPYLPYAVATAAFLAALVRPTK